MNLNNDNNEINRLHIWLLKFVAHTCVKVVLQHSKYWLGEFKLRKGGTFDNYVRACQSWRAEAAAAVCVIWIPVTNSKCLIEINSLITQINN